MNLTVQCVIIFLAFIVSSTGKKDPLTGAVPKQKVRSDPQRPSISDSFQVEVEGIFRDGMSGADGTLYFDRPNNIAAMEVLWQNDVGRRIYSFDTNELILIKGYDCEVKKMPDKPSESFFPFTIDPDSGRKLLGSAEEALYFQNSRYVQDVYDGAIATHMYQGYIDVPMYQKKNCSVTHHFTMSGFATAHCESRFCDPVLLSVTVCCAGVEEEIEGETEMVGSVDHIYRFHNFIDSIENENAFHPPPGVYCDRKNTQSFPNLPMYFSFTYDLTKNKVQVGNVVGLNVLHKKVWYDGDLQLVRVDAFDDIGFQKDSQIYDFYNGMSYQAYFQLNVTTRKELDTELSLQLLTLLPPQVFPRAIHKTRGSPVFVGLRQLHGLVYHVWSVMSKGKAYNTEQKTVTELYFQTSVTEKDGEIVKEAGQQLSFIEIYMYMLFENTNDIQLLETTFVPINNFRSASRDFSAFDISRWFDKDEKRAFEIDVTGPAMIAETRSYSDFLEQLYLEIITLGSFSIIRISKMEISSRNFASNTTTYSGWILESPGILGYDTQRNESDLNTTFSELVRLTRDEKYEFSVDDQDGLKQTFVLSSFRQAKTTRNKGKPEKTNKGDRTYSAGVIAATALTMLVLGLVVGFIGITSLRKKYAAKEGNINLIENPSANNKRVDLNSFSADS